jgi:hypothetical protein
VSSADTSAAQNRRHKVEHQIGAVEAAIWQKALKALLMGFRE